MSAICESSPGDYDYQGALLLHASVTESLFKSTFPLQNIFLAIKLYLREV